MCVAERLECEVLINDIGIGAELPDDLFKLKGRMSGCVVGSSVTRLLIGVLALSVSACVVHVRSELQPLPSYEFRPAGSPHPIFTYAASGPVALGEPIEVLKNHDVLPISYRSSGANGHSENRVEGVYFRSSAAGAHKLVIVLPIWGIREYPSEKISYGYARHSKGDANVIWIFGRTPLIPWEALSSTTSEKEWIVRAEDGVERYRTAVINIRRLLDWAETREEIDASRVAIVGFSMSALVAATVLGNDHRISSAVLMMGGARLADVFANCNSKVGRAREHVLESYGWSLAQFHDFFEQRIGIADPIHYFGHYNPERTLMIDAAFDDCMPASSRDALWEATGRPERISLLYKHKAAFYGMTPLGLNFLRWKIYRFIDRVL